MKTALPGKSYVQWGLRERTPRREHGKIERLMRAPSGRVFKVEPRGFDACLSLGWRFLNGD